MPGAVAESSRMLPPVRVGIGVLFVLAVANGGFLYLFPSQAGTDYAWAIAPAASAAFMGAGYLAGAVGTGLALGAKGWESVRALVPGFCALGLASFAATLIHSEKFRWDYVPTWLWTVVYASLPLGAVALMLLQRRVAPAESAERDPRLRRLSPALLTGGVLLVAAGVALLAAPA